MSGISPKLPLSNAKPEIAYVTNKNLNESIQQNLKNLILTNPGEKVFDINFGAGVRQFLFENADDTTSRSIIDSISSQISNYMPFIQVQNIDANITPDSNAVYITIAYSIPSISLADSLSLEISRN